jgi:choline dehydrogenase
MNGAARQRPSVGPTPRNLAHGVRMNPALTYLAAASGRLNLEIRSETLVDHVIIRGKRATGVLTADGQTIEARDVVLTAGSYNSPPILLRSGIGPSDQLRELGIARVHHLPGVGTQLMDHPLTDGGLCEYALAPHVTPRPFVRCFMKARSRQVDDEIDLHIYWFERYDDELSGWFLNFCASLMYSRSHGSVRLTSADPLDPPTIDLNYFSDPADLEALCDGVEIARRLAETPPAAQLMTRVSNDLNWSSRDELRAHVRQTISTTHHPSTTCKMGPAEDPLAVVDKAGRVHGIEHLRVADASIFPYSPRANLHFTICAVAEKIADMMRIETGTGR